MASPSGYFSEAGKKSEVSELKKLLDEAAIQRDPTQYKKVIQRVIACMTLGMDMSSLFMQMIKVNPVQLVKDIMHITELYTWLIIGLLPQVAPFTFAHCPPCR